MRRGGGGRVLPGAALEVGWAGVVAAMRGMEGGCFARVGGNWRWSVPAAREAKPAAPCQCQGRAALGATAHQRNSELLAEERRIRQQPASQPSVGVGLLSSLAFLPSPLPPCSRVPCQLAALAVAGEEGTPSPPQHSPGGWAGSRVAGKGLPSPSPAAAQTHPPHKEGEAQGPCSQRGQSGGKPPPRKLPLLPLAPLHHEGQETPHEVGGGHRGSPWQAAVSHPLTHPPLSCVPQEDAWS